MPEPGPGARISRRRSDFGRCPRSGPQGFHQSLDPAGNRPVPDPRSPALLVYQPRFVENLKVVADRGLGASHRLDQRAGADLPGLGGDEGEQPEPGRVGKGSEGAGKVDGLLFAHRRRQGRSAAVGVLDQIKFSFHDSILTDINTCGNVLDIDVHQCEVHLSSDRSDFNRRLLAEFVGTGMLSVAVIGSGIMASRLSPDDVGLQLLQNALATAAALAAIILAVGPVSGGHLNPVVTAADCFFGGLSRRHAAGYGVSQLTGAVAGAVLANMMFGLPAVEMSTNSRSSASLWLAEILATFGLLLVIFGVVRSGRTSAAPFAVGAYIGGAYFFTASTGFANPALTAARSLSDTFAGIALPSVPGFVVAQFAGAVVAVFVIRILYPAVSASAGAVVVPQTAGGSDGGS